MKPLLAPRSLLLASSWLLAPGSSLLAQSPPPAHSIIPAPVSAEMTPGVTFSITPATAILVPGGREDVGRLGRELSALLAPSLEKPPAVVVATGPPTAGTIALGLDPADRSAGPEGYELTIDTDRIRIVAGTPAGLFYGIQTLRHLLPPWIEYRGLRPRPAVLVPGGRIVDRPRFEWRGAMLDVARHFFGVADVKRYIDLVALYKINRLHLHLSDDQGWRVEIKSWPNLARHGGSTGVWGSAGGYYTQDQYREIVRYAAGRFITVVPEIDVPSHTNAALASYPELNCDGKAPPLYTGIEVGFSSLCVDKDITYRFLDDVVRELAALTPGPYIHIGGDEVKTLTKEQYARFMERAQAIVHARGKQPIGWDEIAQATRLPTTIVQHWRPEFTHGTEGMRLILSPAHKAYLDMKYHAETPIGLDWAARIEVQEAYNWEPAAFAGVPESSIVGVEAPIWSETLQTMADVEYMAFPRLTATAELGWSPVAALGWDGYSARLAAQAPRWSALGINFYRSPQVPWR